jgi:biopolymer transport protein ExbD
MANKPSKSSHRIRPPEGLNLTPLIDMITCLMFFLLMFAAVIPVALIDAPLPKIASTLQEIQKAKDEEKQLEVSVMINDKGFVVKASEGGEHSFPVGSDGKFPYDSLHKYLVQLKSKRPDSKEITLVPADDVAYEVMVDVMDASRELARGDTGYQAVPPDIAQKPEAMQFNRLFPDVSIGGI